MCGHLQQRLETEGLAVVFVYMQLLGNTECNGSGCGSCFITGKGWWAVKAGASLGRREAHTLPRAVSQ